MFFLHQRARLNSTIVMSFCKQQMKVGCGLLQGAVQGRMVPGYLREGEAEWRVILTMAV